MCRSDCCVHPFIYEASNNNKCYWKAVLLWNEPYSDYVLEKKKKMNSVTECKLTKTCENMWIVLKLLIAQDVLQIMYAEWTFDCVWRNNLSK